MFGPVMTCSCCFSSSTVSLEVKGTPCLESSNSATGCRPPMISSELLSVIYEPGVACYGTRPCPYLSLTSGRISFNSSAAFAELVATSSSAVMAALRRKASQCTRTWCLAVSLV